jgi:predicted nucleic acid-binding Zn ribbon protein
MVKFCPNCGKSISDKENFCTDCGENFEFYQKKSDDKKIERKYSLSQLVIYGIVFVIILILLFAVVSFFNGMTGNIHSTGFGSNSPPIQSTTSLPIPTENQTARSNPSNLPLLIPTESQTDRNTRIANEIVSNYHKSHIYSLNDMYVCVDMASDVWDMLKAQGINAKINIGNVNKDVTDIKDADHAWILAEISPNQYLALEATGGYSVEKSDNPRYYYGWSYNSPKELKDALDKLKHPCSDGYIFGSDEKCHAACGGNTYCTGNNVCVNGQCRGCNSGYILGDDLKCHQSCGGATIYCTGDSICVNGQCQGCSSGYILGTDLKCHQPCGSTTNYCTGDSICLNGQCRGCATGYYLGTDFRCYKS